MIRRALRRALVDVAVLLAIANVWARGVDVLRYLSALHGWRARAGEPLRLPLPNDR